MTLKDKMKTYNFWISIASAIVLIVRIVGEKFNFFVDATLLMDITTGLCSIFVICGILSVPKSKTSTTPIQSATQESINKVTEIIETITEKKVELPTPNQSVVSELQQTINNSQNSDNIVEQKESEFVEQKHDEQNFDTHNDTPAPQPPIEVAIPDTDESKKTEEIEDELIPENTITEPTQEVSDSIPSHNEQPNNSDLTATIENLKKAIYDASKILESLNK